MVANTFVRAGDPPANPNCSSDGPASAFRVAGLSATNLPRRASRTSAEKGGARKSAAPSCMASTASCSLAADPSTMTGGLGRDLLRARDERLKRRESHRLGDEDRGQGPAIESHPGLLLAGDPGRPRSRHSRRIAGTEESASDCRPRGTGGRLPERAISACGKYAESAHLDKRSNGSEEDAPGAPHELPHPASAPNDVAKVEPVGEGGGTATAFPARRGP